MRYLFFAAALFIFAPSAQAQYNTYASELCTTLNERWKVCWRTDTEDDEEPYFVDLKEPKKEAALLSQHGTLSKADVSLANVDNAVEFNNGSSLVFSSLPTLTAGTITGTTFVSTNDSSYTAVLPEPARQADEPKPCRGFVILADGRRLDLCKPWK